MHAGNNDGLILPVPPEPFALIVGAAMQRGAGESIEALLRRMGLKPERVEGTSGDAEALIAAPRFRLTFGAVSVLAGPADAAALDLADPDHPSTSLLAASLPRQWRDGGLCWVFVPEREPGRKGGPKSSAGEPTRMREFFKMMVLLIDLCDASHIFWSPARLWSDAPQFRASIAEMLVSGMPPILHLVAFRRKDIGDGGASIGTRGLALFSGQELEARIPDGWTVADMVRRLSRLALDMMLNGPVEHARTMRGLEADEWVEMLPPPGKLGQRSTVIVELGRGS
ncbi:hypothetical protein SAMN05428974_0071 [Sphingopyxis sp. YR583]|uniref:hypothetical protein n=1 Tax=Sphingopyxis sp. YR583 TaxID=1881047 RepID=UPI0008A76C27|nr:hypothetical protein [Sphingopyxis sp. YR583]SEH10837.1 hypothetical protein SAMN05428974_0071 [Sphingopyxis sp. YR583]